MVSANVFRLRSVVLKYNGPSSGLRSLSSLTLALDSERYANSLETVEN